MRSIKRIIVAGCILTIAFSSCKKSKVGGTDPGVDPPVVPPVVVVEPPFDINALNDTYEAIAPFANSSKWGPYNVHDPAIIKDGEFYYCYTTDAGFGIDVRLGHQIRKSKDLVNWTFVGWVFDTLPTKGSNFIKQNGGTPFNSLWAPYVIKVGNEYRLYYSLSSAKPRLSVIGLATSTSPTGPWVEKDLVVTSLDNAAIQTNAIDPTVLVDSKSGNHYFYYGSGWDGIYMLKLDPATGLAQTTSDKGKRIANRGFTGGKYNGNIEGPEIIYNSELNKYFMFIAYDWIDTKYNVRVGRSDSPEGPFYDYKGRDINLNEDHGPMIIAPYKFMDHSGWQGTSHCAVFKDNSQYYIAHQGRPGINKFYMVLHVRKLFWTQDGWPVASPERYAAVEQTAVSQTELIGNWEQIVLGYRVVVGYDKEQFLPDFQTDTDLKLNADGTINADAGSKWTYNSPWLQINWSNGFVDKVNVSRERDWEKKLTSTLVFTGLNNEGTAVWGKKKL